MRIRILPLLLLLLLTIPTLALASDDDSDPDEGNLPEQVEAALTTILDNLSTPNPSNETLATLLEYVTSNKIPYQKIQPAKRKNGRGTYVKGQLNVPLKKVLSYMFNTSYPSEILCPAVVRHNVWMPDSEVLARGQEIANASLPPAAPISVHGQEIEETTPDSNSGCYYRYTLDRFMLLTTWKGRTILFNLANLPQDSEIGMKGANIGKDSDWNHVYSGVTGTNLPLLGWAKTNIYGSTTVSFLVDDGDKTSAYFFKWFKAGWSGVNAVQPKHIRGGLERYLNSLGQVLEHPNTPTPEGFAAEYQSLCQLPDEKLEAMLSGYNAYLVAQNDKLLKEKPFSTVLANGGYAKTMGRDNMIAEIMKLLLREKHGTLPAEAAATLHQ